MMRQIDEQGVTQLITLQAYEIQELKAMVMQYEEVLKQEKEKNDKLTKEIEELKAKDNEVKTPPSTTTTTKKN